MAAFSLHRSGMNSTMLFVIEMSEREGQRVVTLPLLVVIFAVALLVVLTLILFSLGRKRNPIIEERAEGGIARHLESLVNLSHGCIIDGNSVEIIQNGDWYEVLFDDLEAAEKTIHFETFLWKKGKLSERATEVLSRKASQGLTVRVLLDASGGSGIPREHFRRMQEAGCLIRKYHPIRISNLGELNNRNHRKTAIIDGRVGHIGGHCIVDDWIERDGKPPFRDISVRVKGPVVAQLQSCFSDAWIEETGDVFVGDQYFPKLEPAGEIKTHLAYVTPKGSHSAVELLHYTAITLAEKQILVQNPYFIVGRHLVEVLSAAVARGVAVKIMLPSAEATDNPIVQHASHHHYGALLKEGVRIFEYQRTLLHQKVLTIDHIWSSVGSTNFDKRSFEINDEASLGIRDEKIAAQLEQIFEEDLAHCHEWKLEDWKKRSLWHRLIDGTTYVFNEQL